MKKNCTNPLLFLGLLFCLSANAQTVFFADVKESSCKTAGQQRVIVPQKYRTVSLDTVALVNFLHTVPLHKNIKDLSNKFVFILPLPNGSSARFNIWESPVMEPALAAKYPTIKTYSGQGIDDLTATIKISWTSLGFRAMILSAHSSPVFIDPYIQATTINYIVYYRSDFKTSDEFIEPPLPAANNNNIPYARPAGIQTGGVSVGTQLLTYRWAIACTHQYASAATGLPSPSVAQTLMAITNTVNRVNAVYEKELSVNFVLVANENAIIFNSSASDPLSSYNTPTVSITFTDILNKTQAVIDANIGDANYDLGQEFTSGAGGFTDLGIVCQSNLKAKSAVGVAHPVGDPFNIDYVCHELGHEFGAHHPFNSNADFCGQPGQGYQGTNDEPGSGSTIVGYASSNSLNGLLCADDNLQAESDPYFNTVNFDEIINYINNTGTCATITPTINAVHSGINHSPIVNADADYVIPVNTPFVLTGSGTDPDGDALTYCWEEFDTGGPFGAWNAPMDNAPIFRSFLPVTTPTRYFPKLQDVINNTTTVGEIMPSYTRTLHFRLTARDNNSNGGGVSYSGNAVTVDGTSGPFILTYPDVTGVTWSVGEFRTITWNPAGTQAAPVSCVNVMIQLSTDGGLTYPDTLTASTPNTGTAQIQVPNHITNTARIRIIAVGNVFYDISNNNFAIVDSTVPITWINFSATQKPNNTASLIWTVSEIDVKYYQVERRTDSTNFKAIDSIASITGHGVNQLYSFTDESPFQGTNYYRIKEVNANGSFTYSTIQSISFTNIPTPWAIFPNPAKSYVNVQSNGSSSNAMLQLFDATGKLVYEKALISTIPGQVTPISVSKFAKGIYILKITSTTGIKELSLLID